MADTRRETRRLGDAFLRRPAVALATLFILGIVAHRWMPDGPRGWLAAGVMLLIGAAVTFQWRAVSGGLVAVAVLCAGVTAGQLESCHYPGDHIARFAGDEPRLGTVEVRIVQPVRTLHRGTHEARPIRPRQVTQAEVIRVRTREGWAPASGRILVQINVPRDDLEIKQTVTAFGMLQRPRRAMNPGQFVALLTVL